MTAIQHQHMDDFDLIIFGGDGDLSFRKIYPALYHRLNEQQINENSRILAVSRTDNTQKQFQERLKEKLEEYVKDIDQDVLKRLLKTGLLNQNTTSGCFIWLRPPSLSVQFVNTYTLRSTSRSIHAWCSKSHWAQT